MARPRRRIISGKLYEICLRARRGLPFPPSDTINIILQSILARTQRDDKVEICHFLWMSNHLHLLLVAKDSRQCANFYSEVAKKCTDAIKQLLGLSSLELWDDRPSVFPVLDLEAAKNRISYFYCNPAAANLVRTIGEYPGVSSWGAFLKEREGQLRACVTTNFPWVRLPTITVLPAAVMSQRQDFFCSRRLISQSPLHHKLSIEPNAWMKCFGVSDHEDVKEINREIMKAIENKEHELEIIRQREGKRVLGAAYLRREKILREHTPKRVPMDRKIFFITTVREYAISFLKSYKEFCAECREAYAALCLGCSVPWPLGGFKPPIPPLANAIA